VAQINSALFSPVYLLGLATVILILVGQVLTSRGRGELAEKLSDLGFGLALLTGAYIVVLLLIALISQPNLIYDAAVNIVIVALFFLVLLVALFGLFELIFSRRRRRKRVTPEGD
jgi:cytochrome bd-type quinol oxidase subunit 2